MANNRDPRRSVPIRHRLDLRNRDHLAPKRELGNHCEDEAGAAIELHTRFHLLQLGADFPQFGKQDRVEHSA